MSILIREKLDTQKAGWPGSCAWFSTFWSRHKFRCWESTAGDQPGNAWFLSLTGKTLRTDGSGGNHRQGLRLILKDKGRLYALALPVVFIGILGVSTGQLITTHEQAKLVQIGLVDGGRGEVSDMSTAICRPSAV